MTTTASVGVRSPITQTIFLWCAVLVLLLATPAAAQTFSRWSKSENLGAVINSSDRESCLFVTNSGLSLYFASTRPGGSGALDIYVSQRSSRSDPWGTPQNLGASINSSSADQLPFVSPDGHTLYFASTRPGTEAGYNIYASFRRNASDDFGWEAPVAVAELNSPSNEFAPWGFEDPATGRLVLYFSSDRPGGPGGFDTWVSHLLADGKFSPPILVEELSTADTDYLPTVRHDGLELFISSNRPGGYGDMDIWRSTRATTAESWSAPVNIGPGVNTSAGEMRGGTFGDARELYFFSGREGGSGGLDLYIARRTKTSLFPITGSTRGASGSVFRTSAQLSNPGELEIEGDLVFHPAGVEASSSDPSYRYRLGPYESQSFHDVVSRIGASGVGSLEVVPDVGPIPAVAVRIWNGNSPFSVPPLDTGSLMVAGMHSAMKMPDNTGTFRTNIAIRTMESGATIWVCMHDPDGTFIRGFTREFPPNYLIQMPVAELLGGEVKADQMVMFTVNGGSAIVSASTAENAGVATTLEVIRPVWH
jgi:hypothetical protein